MAVTLSAAYFHACNRGKRSVVADFTTEEGRALVRGLARSADVVIENFKVGGLAKYGLDYASLAAINPRLIYCSITGFGQDGPYAERAGYDFLIQGMAGAMSITGDPAGQPTKTGYAVADLFSGLYATIGILAALRRRDDTGEGAWIDCALMDSQVGVLANQALNYLVSGETPTRLGNAHPNVVPYEVFPVRDGHVIVAVGNDGQFRRLCTALGEPSLGADARFASNAAAGREPRRSDRADHGADADGSTRATCSPISSGRRFRPGRSTRSRMCSRTRRCSTAACASIVPAPAADGGAIPGVRTPLMIDGVPQAHTRPSPQIGEHQADVLADRSWSVST